MAQAEIPRIHRPDRARFEREHLRPGRPAILTGLADGWPALERWRPERLAREHGDRVVRGFALSGGEITSDRRYGLVMEDMRLADVLAGDAEGARTRHRVRTEIAATIPALLDDFETPSCCRGALALERFFWVTPAGLRTGLHWDSPENLFVQIIGSRRFHFIPPSRTASVYPYPFLSATPQFSRVDYAAPDLARFPRYAEAKPLTCTVGPGESLFLPSGWWHAAESDELTIAVNFWWLRPAILPRAALFAAAKRLRARLP